MKILVIDDNHGVGEVLTRMLTPLCSKSPTFVDNIPEALEMLKAGDKFDLVTLDLRLPGWTVERTLNQIQTMRELNGEGLIVVVTGVDDPTLADRVMEAGAHGFILKPMVRHRESFFDTLRALALSIVRQPTRYQRNIELAEKLVAKIVEVSERKDATAS